MGTDDMRNLKQVRQIVLTRDGLPECDCRDEIVPLDFGATRVYDARIIDWLGWVATVLAVGGVVLNNFQLWPCFLLWMASNGLSAVIHCRMGPRSLFFRDLIFFVLAAMGLWQWTR